MSRERAFIDRLAAFARHPAARGLTDDCAVLPMGDRDLVLTHDMLVEGVHFLATDQPEDVAWKLVAVNLSDLAAKGASPLGVLLGYPLGRDTIWDDRFADGLAVVLDTFGVPLFGGDTVAVPERAPRQYGLTALGETAPGKAPARGGARAGDLLCVTGTIGAAGLGLAIAQARMEGPAALLDAYRRPRPRLAEGKALAPHVHAMADVSDGLLLDAGRIADASGLAVAIDLDAVPVPSPCRERAERIAAATAGDDYELLFAIPPGVTLPQLGSTRISVIGGFAEGRGLTLHDGQGAVPLPATLGYEHGAP